MTTQTLIYIPSGLQSPELEIMLSKAQISINNGYKTFLVSCSGGKGYACSFNIYGLKSICHSCRSQVNKGLSHLRGSYYHFKTPKNITKYLSEEEKLSILKNRWNVKRYIFKDCDVGQAAYSSYISATRDQDLEGKLSRWSLCKLLNTSQSLLEWFEEIIDVNKITSIVLYNGRQNQSRPLVRLAQLRHIDLEVMEFSGQHAGCVYSFHNNLPQDLIHLNECIQLCWQAYRGNIKQVVEEYYSYKRLGGVINDSKAYVNGQQTGLLPDGWDASKHNIGIFNSSEDEFAALGGEYDNTLYKNQSEAIARICEALCDDSNIVLWLRIHPNLHKVNWSFAQQFSKLESKFSNFHVIPATSPISSYSLLDASSIVLSFGSTMGVEAAYWGKPSVLVGRCVYEKLGSVYTPNTHAEVVSLLRDRKLKVLSPEGAYKVALFWSKGGTNLHGLTGDRVSGFNFFNHKIKRSLIMNLYFGFSKFIEKYIISFLINFMPRKVVLPIDKN